MLPTRDYPHAVAYHPAAPAFLHLPTSKFLVRAFPRSINPVPSTHYWQYRHPLLLARPPLLQPYSQQFSTTHPLDCILSHHSDQYISYYDRQQAQATIRPTIRFALCLCASSPPSAPRPIVGALLTSTQRIGIKHISTCRVRHRSAHPIRSRALRARSDRRLSSLDPLAAVIDLDCAHSNPTSAFHVMTA